MRTWLSPLAILATAALVLAGCGGGQETGETSSAREASPAEEAAAPASQAGAEGYTVTAVADGGSITGKVGFEGTPPPAETVEITKDPSVCGEEKVLKKVEVNDGGLAGVVLWIDGIAQGKDWGALDGGTVDQKQCDYTPHIQLVRAGDTVEIINSDAILHNVHAYHEDKETLFNLAQPMQGMKTPKTLTRTGPVHLKCDVHSWMSAWIFVAGHPYYTVSAADGTFTLDQVPPGTYTVKAWHAAFGEKTASVTVDAGGTATLDFTMP